MDKNVQVQVLEMLASNEEMLSKFYDTCSVNFPILTRLWDKLATEEIDHANQIRKLVVMLEEDKLSFDAERFNPSAIIFFDYVRNLISDISSGNNNLNQALAIAVDMENTLLEKDTFRSFETDSPELKALLEKLSCDTVRHRSILQETWEKAKSI